MSRSYIQKALREQITLDARNRCGYCLTSARITGSPMEIDHIVPESLGGSTERENLWLSCSLCNDHKATASQPQTLRPARSCASSIRASNPGRNTSSGAAAAT